MWGDRFKKYQIPNANIVSQLNAMAIYSLLVLRQGYIQGYIQYRVLTFYSIRLGYDSKI